MPAAAQNRLTVARALYVIAAMLVLIPLSEFLPALWPLRLGTPDWRFAVTGMGSGAIMTPMLGVFLALAAAATLEHRRILAIGSWALFACALVLVALAGLFALDALEIRARMRQPAQPAMLGATLKAMWKMGVGCVVALVLAFSARRMAKRLRQEAAEQQPAMLVRAEHD